MINSVTGNSAAGTAAGSTGVSITDVTPGSLAAELGFQAGDRILAVNDRPVQSSRDLERLLLVDGRAGHSVAVRIERNRQQQTIQLPTQRLAQVLPSIRSQVPDGVPGGAAMGLTLNQNGSLGVVVAQVEPNSPAALAGLQPGDQIIAIHGQPVTAIQQVRRAVTLAGAGDTLRLTYKRGNGQFDTTVPLSSYAAVFGTTATEGVPTQRSTGPALGVRVAQDTSGGVMVTAVQPNSPAAQAGIQVGDQIVSAQEVPIKTPAALAAIVEQVGTGANLPLVYRRNGQETRVTSAVGSYAELFGANRAVAGDRSAIGVRVRENAQGGPLVTEVSPNSPAARAGLRPGDQIVAVDGQTVNSPQDVANRIQRAGIGSAVQIRYSREGRLWQTTTPVSDYATIHGEPSAVERQVARQPLEQGLQPPPPPDSQTGSPQAQPQGQPPSPRDQQPKPSPPPANAGGGQR